MQKYFELTSAVEYIEDHMLDNCSQADIAHAACVSLSALQKMFRFTFGYSINEYIMKRKMTTAAEELSETKIPVADLAFKYGYTSTEAFSRAFSKVNCVLPSEYRKGKRAQAVFTPLQIDDTGIRRKSPLLIEAVHRAKDCYIVCFDVAGMVKINEISKEAGNLALMEAVRRIHTHAVENMQIFRIGGDEFALITPYPNISDAEAFAAGVLAHNGEPFFYKGQPVQLYLRSWYGKNVLTEAAPNPAKELQQKVKYLGVTEIQNEK